MNVLFVYSLNSLASPTKPIHSFEDMQFGISYISALLKSRGHKTELLVLSSIMGLSKNKLETVDDCIQRFNPRLIGFTSIATEYSFITSIAKYIRGKYPGIYLLIGGSHASLNPSEALTDDFDALCVGEGEYPTLELVDQLEKTKYPSGILNLWLKKSGEIEKNPPRPFLHNIDNLPFPDRDMWLKWIYEVKSRYSILLGRGCPFQCSYCSNHALKNVSPGKYVRYRSAENIIEELKETVKRFPTQREVYFEVETIWINKEIQKWTLDLCDKLEMFNKTLSSPLNFGVNIRVTPNMDIEILFAALKRSNFKFINIGLESGSERIRREVLKRFYSNDDIIKTVELARKYGLRVNVLNMVGFPGETLNDFNETVRVNRACLPDRNAISIFFPYPGTDLYFLCKEKGLLNKTVDVECERSKATLDMPEFSARQIQKGYEWFDYYVYKGYRPLHKILVNVFIKKLKSKPLSNYIMRRLAYLDWFKGLKEKVLSKKSALLQ